MKFCKGCNTDKELDDFALNRSAKDGRQNRCRECREKSRLARVSLDPEGSKIYNRKRSREYNHLHPETALKFKLKSKFNLHEKWYENILETQNYKCAICNNSSPGNKNRFFSIDHDHNCCKQRGRSCGKCVRGLLCRNCNIGLGLFMDSEQFLENAKLYLRKFK